VRDTHGRANIIDGQLAMDRDGLEGEKNSWGWKVDYPNEKWDYNLWYKNIGADFDPSLGFTPRHGVIWVTALTQRTRLSQGPVQEMTWNGRLVILAE
jgi:hypothetical protein